VDPGTQSAVVLQKPPYKHIGNDGTVGAIVDAAVGAVGLAVGSALGNVVGVEVGANEV